MLYSQICRTDRSSKAASRFGTRSSPDPTRGGVASASSIETRSACGAAGAALVQSMTLPERAVTIDLRTGTDLVTLLDRLLMRGTDTISTHSCP